MTTEERLEKLEREIVEMKTKICTKALCVLDDQGQERIKLNVDEDGPLLAMIDKNGQPSAVITVTEDGPGLLMLDENGKHRAKITVAKDGPGLFMMDENEKLRVGMNVDENGAIAITIMTAWDPFDIWFHNVLPYGLAVFV